MKKVVKKIINFVLYPLYNVIRSEIGRSNSVMLQDIGSENQRHALRDTADYVRKHMSHVDSVDSPRQLLSLAMSWVEIKTGLYLEFGVFSGGSINHIADGVQADVYGFDSFEGLPERWRDSFGAGCFGMDVLPSVRANVILVKGWFDRTLPDFLEAHGEDVGFLHIDCDLYSSTKTIFVNLAARIKPGTIIVFDEYFNYPGWRDGEYKAFQEFIAESGLSYQYLSYNRLHEQVCVKIVARPYGHTCE